MKTFNTKLRDYKYLVIAAGIIAALCTAFLIGKINVQAAAFDQQMDVGSRGGQVTMLQNFLASNSVIYPEGIVSGYYGELTSRAVAQFQLHYNLPPVGRVGPLTLAKLNAVMAKGQGLDIQSAVISGVTVTKNSTNATIQWQTNENATSRVYYDTTPLTMSEVSANFAIPSISGTQAAINTFSTAHAVTISSLAPHTLYYYTIVSVDVSGNVSMTMPAFFTTN